MLIASNVTSSNDGEGILAELEDAAIVGGWIILLFIYFFMFEILNPIEILMLQLDNLIFNTY